MEPHTGWLTFFSSEKLFLAQVNLFLPSELMSNVDAYRSMVSETLLEPVYQEDASLFDLPLQAENFCTKRYRTRILHRNDT